MRTDSSSLRVRPVAPIGYRAHDSDTISLYLQESSTFLTFTGESSVAFPGD